MSIWDLLGLIGGLAIFLYGMLMMNNSLTAIAGEKLRSVMLTLTKGKVRGYLTGLGVTIINQSSSATTVLEAVLVGAGLMTFQQSLAVTLGSELGSTVLGQLVAFPKLTLIAPLLIAVPFFASLVVKGKRNRNIAMTVLGFGLLLLGMEMMSASMKPLRSYQPFLDLMQRVENPALGILVGLVFTMIIQSSGATSGLTIAMAITGTITLAQAVPINLGASVGTCITAVLGSLALNREAKRTAYIHALFQTIGMLAVYLLLLIPFRGDRLWLAVARWVTQAVFGTDSVARQIANAHTMMPILNHLLVFPLLPLVVRLFNLLFPPREGGEVFGPLYITEGLVEQPEIGLEQAKKEILRVSEIVEQMLGRCSHPFCSDNGREKDIDTINQLDQKVDILRNAIVVFLTKVAGESLSEAQTKRVVMYLYTINELENLADVIDNNIMDKARKTLEEHVALLEEEARDIAALTAMVLENYRKVMAAFAAGDRQAASELLENQTPIREFQADLRHQHFLRMRRGLQVAVEANPIHMDLLNHYNRINRHVVHIAHTMVDNLA